MKLQEAIDTAIKSITTLTVFLAKYPRLNEDTDASLSIFGSMEPSLCLHDSALAGLVLGTSGWERKQGYYGSYSYNWHRTIDGVAVTICNAESLPEPPKEVPPAAFPLMLECF